VILRLRNMTAIDATGLHAFEVLSDRLHKAGRNLIFCGACDQPARIMSQAVFVDHVGEKNLVANVRDALRRAREIDARAGRGSGFRHRTRTL
jgi:SulP family sulfate permease